MSLFGAVTNAVHNVVNTTTQKVQDVVAEVKAKVEDAPSFAGHARDTFEQASRKVDLGVRADANGIRASVHVAGQSFGGFSVGPVGARVSDGTTTLDLFTRDGLGGSTKTPFGKVGAHFKGTDGPATLGAVSFVAGGQEYVLGMVPAAPAPLPLPIYLGKDRTDDVL